MLEWICVWLTVFWYAITSSPRYSQEGLIYNDARRDDNDVDSMLEEDDSHYQFQY